MILSRITIVTGASKEEIEAGIDNIISKSEINVGVRKVIKFPECFKHPKVYTEELKEEVTKDIKESFIIGTFSENILNLMGHLIYIKKN